MPASLIIKPDDASDKLDRIRAFALDEGNKLLRVLDQTKLPSSIEIIEVRSTKDAWDVIKNMNVRGAPCIAAVACLSVIVELNNKLAKFGPDGLYKQFDCKKEDMSAVQIAKWIRVKSGELKTSRPTAVNLAQALNRLCDFAESDCEGLSGQLAIASINNHCLTAIDLGVSANKCLGDFGANTLISEVPGRPLRVLTHCNTGSLATVGHGTAFGVIKSLHELGKLEMVYCTETRPYNQGSRLTAWECVMEKLPSTLIGDSMVASLMAEGKVDAVVVGADRVVANGDTANKIGTFQIAVLAQAFKVPFYIASPTQTIDLETTNGNLIEIELRPAEEMRFIGKEQLAPHGIKIWTPCFDVTPAKYIEAIITEFGTWSPDTIIESMNSVDKVDKRALF